MSTQKKYVSRLIVVLLFLTVACISDDPGMEKPVSVYVAGASNDRAVYWKDGVMVPLTPPEVRGSFARSIFVSGENVYVTGSVSPASNQPVYWRNGELVTLPETDQRPNAVTYATSIAVSGEDVYVASMSCPPYDYCQAIVWKNSEPLSLDSQYGARISAMAVSASRDIYVAGQGVPALLWKNGKVQKMSGQDYGASSHAIFVNGDDVYVAGTVMFNAVYTPCYWKNGRRIDLPAGDPHGVAEAIFVAGNDVYVAGNLKTETGNRAVVWKNGTPLTLASEALYSTATCLWVSGKDVYVGGIEVNGSQPYTAKYWKNGVGISLTDRATDGYVTSIMVK